MRWALAQDPPRGGDYNMAKDEHLLLRAALERRPILRLYRWERPTLSVGRNQRVAGEIDPAACQAAGIPIVRRMTGGQAVLHGGDLTYAVAAPLEGGRFGKDILASYRALSGVFVYLFRELGFEPAVQAYSGRERAGRASPLCFVTPSAYEILVEGKKLVGSAQRRRPEAFLQHGSIPLIAQGSLLARLFRGSWGATLAETMTDLETLGLWRRMGEAEFTARLLGAFQAVLEAEWEPLSWGPEDERRVAARLPAFAALEPTALGAQRGTTPADPCTAALS